MKSFTLLIAFSLASILSFSEGNENTKPVLETISFKVVDANNESIVGAEVSIEGLGMTAYTDIDGFTNVEVPKGTDQKIKISFISYSDIEVNLTQIKNGIITLTEK